LIEEVVVAGRSWRIAVPGLGLAVLFAIAACSAGQITQTSNQVPAIPGANASAGTDGSIALRDLTVEYNSPAGYAAGDSAPLVVRIFNSGGQAVRLVGVDAGGAAASVRLTGGPAPTGLVATATATPTAEPGPSAIAVEIAPSGYALLVPGQGPHLELVDLSRPLRPGDSVPLTFRFSDGSSTEVTVPFGVPHEPAPRGTPVVPPHGAEGGEAE
jgi:copper(I)-binding protein